MKKKTLTARIAMVCSVIVFLCCFGGCSSQPEATAPTPEATVPIEASSESESYAESVDMFYDLESFLEYAENPESEGLADLASLEYFYLPTGIPEGYRLYKITAAKNDIGFWYLPEEALASDDAMLSAESRNEHFLFLSPRVYYDGFGGDETILTWQENGDFLMLYMPKDFVVDDREAICQTEKFCRNSEGRFQSEVTYVDAPPAEHFSTVQEVVEHIKAVKAAGVEETVSSNHVVLYDKEYIYALKESPLPDYQHETVTLIIEGINIRYLADEHLSEDQVNFWWFKEYTDENVENLTRRYNLKQYKDTKFFFGQQHDDRVIYWWENGNQFSFHYPAESGVNHVDIIDYLVVEKFDVDIEVPNFFAYDESMEAYLVQHQFAEETGDLLTAKTPIAMTEEETQILLDLLEPYADTLDGDVLKSDFLRYYSIEIDDRMTLTIDPELGNYGENGDSYMLVMEHRPGAYVKGTYIDAELVEFLRDRLAEEG